MPFSKGLGLALKANNNNLACIAPVYQRLQRRMARESRPRPRPDSMARLCKYSHIVDIFV